MKLQWFTTAALILTEGNTAIAFDPFLGLPLGKRWPDMNGDEFSAVDAVFVTHGHFDHILEIPGLLTDSDAPIYATDAPSRTLARHGMAANRLRTIRPGDVSDVGPFRIEAYPGRHCTFDGPLVRQTAFSPRLWRNLPRALRLMRYAVTYREKGETLFYEVGADGTRMQVMGSLGLRPDAVYPTGADALILPFQGRSDLLAYGWPIVERLQPKAVYLDHCDDSFPPLTAAIDTSPFCDLLTSRGIPCRALTPRETIDL